MSQRVLITGGAGFIGCNLARRLARNNYRVQAVDNLFLGRASNLPTEVPLVVGDIAEEPVWGELEPADGIVHLAGASSAPMFPDNLVECYRNNILGFIRVLDFARVCGARRVIYASTSSVYGNVTPPLREDGDLDLPNFYAVSKYCMEEIARMYTLQYPQVETIGLRFMSVYGPREDHKGIYANLVSQFIWDVEAGRAPVIYGDGTQSRDFTNVGDIAQAIQRVLEHPEPLGYTIFNVGTSHDTNLNDLVQLLSGLMDVPVTPEYIPNPVKKGYVRQQLANLDRISSTLGYQPTISLREGIQEILETRRAAR